MTAVEKYAMLLVMGCGMSVLAPIRKEIPE